MGVLGSDGDVTAGDIQEVFSQANEPATPLATTEVAGRGDRPTETALRNVTTLVELDRVGRKRRDAPTLSGCQRNESVSPGQQPTTAASSAFVNASTDSPSFALDSDGTVDSRNDGPKRSTGGDEVEIDAERTGSMWEVTVHDESIAPCRRTIERHGGEIRVESHPSTGSTVPVLFPRAGDADE